VIDEPGPRGEIERTLADHLQDESPAAALGHLVLLGIVIALARGGLPIGVIAAWAAAVLGATLARLVLQRQARSRQLPPATAISAARTTMTALGLAWGLGTAIAAQYLPLVTVALILVGLAGLLAGAVATLVADRWAFNLYLGAMLGPVLAGILLAGHRRPEDATVILILVFGAFMWRAHGRAHGTLVQRLRTEQLLRESEARFRLLTDSNLLGIGFWDASGAINDANDEYLRTIGYTRDDLIAGAVNFRSLTPSEYAALDARVLERLAAGEQVPPWEKELIRKDGQRVPVLLGVAPFKDRADRGVVFTLDITHRKLAEENQQTLLRELQAALAEVKTLQGWIRICANCKRVLNDAGVWEQFEAYVHAHSGVDFSHGICPDCATKWAADV
jgi:PAS domain S-box-containing protein